MKTEICPLCHSKTDLFYGKAKLYFICRECRGVHLQSKFFLDSELERQRYETHNNDVNDLEYQKFVSPITDRILKDFSKNHIGLDFGAGTGPVISKVLSDNQFQVFQYDPYFHPNEEMLEKKYDYIACCEVVEHFYNPNKEYKLLQSLLNENGKLYIMTEKYSSELSFEKWYYKNDPTHVFFYQAETMQYIAENFGFSSCEQFGRLTIFTK